MYRPMLCRRTPVYLRTCEYHGLVHALLFPGQLRAEVHVEVGVGPGRQQKADNRVLPGPDRHVKSRLWGAEQGGGVSVSGGRHTEWQGAEV